VKVFTRFVVFLVVLTFGVSSCGDGPTGIPAPPLQVTVAPDQISMAVGETTEIEVTVQGGAPGAQTERVCRSSDAAVASSALSGTGCTITGEGSGTATIMVEVTRGQESATGTVTVSVQEVPEPTTLTKVAGDGQMLGFDGESAALVVELRDQYGDPMAGVSVRFAGSGAAHAMSSETETTGPDGQASVTVTAASEADTIEVEASVAGVTAVVFTLTVVEKVIPAPASTPRGITWDGNSLWVVAGLDANPEIYQIEPVAGTVLQSFPAPAGQHRGLAWDGSHLWYSSHETARIYRLDPADNGNVVLEFASPGSTPRGLTWDGTHLWHNDAAVSSPVVYRLDPANGDVLGSVASPVGDPLGLAWDGTHLWTAQHADGRSIVRFDPDGGSVVATIPNPGDLPLGLTVDQDGPWLWVSDMNARVIYRLSLDH
jgi:streptogramin lyase